MILWATPSAAGPWQLLVVLRLVIIAALVADIAPELVMRHVWCLRYL